MPEVLNVHVNGSRKKSTFFRKIFLFKHWKINFWERKFDFFKYFLKFQFILFNCSFFCKFRSYERLELHVHLFLNKYDEKKSKFRKFCCNFCKNHFFQKTKTSLYRGLKNKQKTYNIVCSRINSWASTMHAIYLCENSMSHFEQSYLRNDSIFLHKVNTVAVSNKE